jgi:hypothetical protein
MHILADIQHALSGLMGHLPPHIKTWILGEISKVNITHADASKDAKANAVAVIVADVLQVGIAFAHAIVHGLYLEAAASTPAILAPVLESAVSAADTAINEAGQALETSFTGATQTFIPANTAAQAAAVLQQPRLTAPVPASPFRAAPVAPAAPAAAAIPPAPAASPAATLGK